MREFARHMSTTVRVFPDNADTIIWFAMGPFDYESARIPEGLRAAMEAWAETFYSSIDFTDASPDLVAAFDAEGVQLANHLSQLIGQEFAVEYLPRAHPTEPVLLRADGPPSDTAVADAFRARAAAFGEQLERVQKKLEYGEGLRWTARNHTH